MAPPPDQLQAEPDTGALFAPDSLSDSALATPTSSASKQTHTIPPEPPQTEAGGGTPVLARKYRPGRFEDLIGQEAMVRTLAGAIETGRLPHAWMLTGVRGIGKTTTARLIAKALNCVGVDGKGGATMTPCGVCEACRAIAEDRYVDVQEMDAASRTSVDDIREIIDGVRYGPVAARYKIYILDEVHMLSKNAFNALLKTLEEPPPHTKFIFATTEIRKVPVTVLSRCQRFDLRRIEKDVLAAHFAKIAAKEGAKAEAEAVALIAEAADGSVRDGLSLLDQAIAQGAGHVNTDDVKAMLGLADRAASMMLCGHVLKGAMKEALAVFDGMLAVGADPLQILQDVAELVHLLTRAQIIPEEAARGTQAEREFRDALKDIKVPALSRAWQILLKGLGETQSALAPAQAAEMALIRLAYAAELPTPGDLVKKLRSQNAAQASAASGGTAMSGASSAPSGFASAGGQSPLMTAAQPAVLSASSGPSTHGALALAAEPTPDELPCPRSFEEVVELFATQREGGLYAELFSMAHPVSCEVGALEIALEPGAMPGLAPKIAAHLSKWTGRRWLVSLTSAQGAPTLAERAKEAEAKRQDKAQAHPLMQAVLQNFPGAKLLGLKQKEAPLPKPSEDKEEALADLAAEDILPEDND